VYRANIIYYIRYEIILYIIKYYIQFPDNELYRSSYFSQISDKIKALNILSTIKIQLVE